MGIFARKPTDVPGLVREIYDRGRRPDLANLSSVVPLWLHELLPGSIGLPLWRHLLCHDAYLQIGASQQDWKHAAAFQIPLALAPAELRTVAAAWGFAEEDVWSPICTEDGRPGPSLADAPDEKVARLQVAEHRFAHDRVAYVGDLLAAQRGDLAALRARIVPDGEPAIQQRVRYR